jgi:DNA-binding NarL/FixJ family response regulator
MPVRVAIVEDNDVFRETLELLFGMRDEVVVVGSASSGDDAPDLARRVTPDVVLMDYRMPGLNGAEATRAVLASCPSTKVVLLSASVTEEETAEVRAAGAVGFVTKDEDFDRLVSVVCEAAAA